MYCVHTVHNSTQHWRPTMQEKSSRAEHWRSCHNLLSANTAQIVSESFIAVEEKTGTVELWGQDGLKLAVYNLHQRTMQNVARKWIIYRVGHSGLGALEYMNTDMRLLVPSAPGHIPLSSYMHAGTSVVHSGEKHQGTSPLLLYASTILLGAASQFRVLPILQLAKFVADVKYWTNSGDIFAWAKYTLGCTDA